MQIIRNTLRNHNFARLALVFLVLNLVLQVVLDTALPPTAHAAGTTFTVKTNVDPTNGGDGTVMTDGQCSLREAIANIDNVAQTNIDCPAGSGMGDTIKFSSSFTITLDNSVLTGSLNVNKDVNIMGPVV